MWPSESETSEVSPSQLSKILARGEAGGQFAFALVDCREQDEFEICRIEGALLIPLSRFVFEAEEKLPDKSLPVVVYCHHGMRSSKATAFLRKKGYAKAFNVTGGIDAWSVEIDPEVPLLTITTNGAHRVLANQALLCIGSAMLTKRIIPCLDVTDGRVVKGTKFLDLRDAGDPVECAVAYNLQGADELVFLDITASSDNRRTMVDVVQRTAEQCFMPLTVGGGIRAVEDMREMLLAGADKVGVNTAAVSNPDVVSSGAEAFGRQCIVVAIDAKSNGDGTWRVFTHGGRTPTELDAIEWAKDVERRGAGEILLTSMDSDGTKAGYDIALTRAISEAVGIPVIASGGAGNIDHMVEVLSEGKADAVLAASIFHFGEFTVGDVKVLLADKGVPVRPQLSF